MVPIPPNIQSALSAARAESPYERLGVTPLSSAAERKRAYRALSRLLHPDIIRDPNLRPLCNDALVRVNDAFEILSDPIRELAWRARNSFTMPGNAAQSTPSTRPPPPSSDHPEVRELVTAITEVTSNFSVERLERVTEQLINRLLYARDCRFFILDPSLRAAAEELVSFLLAQRAEAVVFSPAISLIRLFLFEPSHPLYRRMVSTLRARIITLLKRDTHLSELEQLVAAARPLDAGSAIVRHPPCVDAFSRRLRRSLLLCRTDRACEVDRIILFKLQEHYEFLPTTLLTELTQEAYSVLLRATLDPTEAADLRRRLHLGADDALTALSSILTHALEHADFERAILYTHLLRFDLSRESEITRQTGMISSALVSFFQTFSRVDNPLSLIHALTFLKQLPDAVRASLKDNRSLRRAALFAHRRCRPTGSIPAPLHPRILLGVSLRDHFNWRLFSR